MSAESRAEILPAPMSRHILQFDNHLAVAARQRHVVLELALQARQRLRRAFPAGSPESCPADTPHLHRQRRRRSLRVLVVRKLVADLRGLMADASARTSKRCRYSRRGELEEWHR